MAALEATGLGLRYRGRWALRGVELTIPAGRMVALVGPNGAGKTTLLQLAVGLLRADEGRLRVLGREPGIASLPEVGFVAQDKPLYREFRVGELLEFGARLNPSWDAGYARARLDGFDIDPTRRAGDLSGGEQAQVALTLALAKRPRLLLLDEPTSNLDPLARRQFLESVGAQARESGTTVVHSSHDIAGLDRHCDHLVVIRGGAVVVGGDIADVVPAGQRLEDVVLEQLRAMAS